MKLNYIQIFRMNLCLVKELGDRAAQGRAYGNLGNTHYLLGNFVEAIKFHRQVRENLLMLRYCNYVFFTLSMSFYYNYTAIRFYMSCSLQNKALEHCTSFICLGFDLCLLVVPSDFP